MNDKASMPLVSVICTAYNHEKYIRKCLDGFVMQKTTFPFEVIVHDDASTDHTADIIREYAKKYPQIVIPIIQTENQRSKKVSIVTNYVAPLINGKYVALCEGDDYWCDPQKLQKQFEAMENNPDCHICLARVRQIKEDGTITKKSMPNFNLKTGVYTTEEFLKLDQGHNFQTASYFFNGAEFCDYLMNPPAFRKTARVGDVPYLLYFSSLGPVYYLEDYMACHRQASIGSWSKRQAESDISKKDGHYLSMIRMFNLFDEFTNNRYHDIISDRIGRTEFDRLLLYGKYKEALSGQNIGFYRTLPFKQKIKIVLGAYFPGILSYIQKKKKQPI